MLLEMEHPLTGSVTLFANPVKFSETPVSYRRIPPQLGADTVEVLETVLGMTRAEIDALAGDKVLKVAQRDSAGTG